MFHFSCFHGSEVHPTSYQMYTGVTYPGGKAAGVWCWSLTSF